MSGPEIANSVDQQDELCLITRLSNGETRFVCAPVAVRLSYPCGSHDRPAPYSSAWGTEGDAIAIAARYRWRIAGRVTLMAAPHSKSRP